MKKYILLLSLISLFSLYLILIIKILSYDPTLNNVKYFYFSNRRFEIRDEKMLKNIIDVILKYLHENNLYDIVISITFIDCNDNKNYMLSNKCIFYFSKLKPITTEDLYNQIEWDKLTFINRNDILVKIKIIH
jgi:hypothetical protein